MDAELILAEPPATSPVSDVADAVHLPPGAHRWGASTDDWSTLANICGEDLLPVVSNPGAVISPSSSLASKGKTPSEYTPDRKIRGIKAWPERRVGPNDLQLWSREPDYGICVQTRRLRAIDVDVDDPVLARDIYGDICSVLGVAPPARRRANSPKFLCPVFVPGDQGKRRMQTKHGVIEFLATGQQFVAAGTHPSGERYDWGGPIPDEFPTLTEEQFESLWGYLAMLHADGETSSAAGAARRRGPNIEMADPVAEFLKDSALVLGKPDAGKLIVRCPWEAEHSSGETGDGSTVWFPAGSRGYLRGHFKCQHAHCLGRTARDFANAIGYDGPLNAGQSAEDDFCNLVEDVEVEVVSPGGAVAVVGGQVATITKSVLAKAAARATAMPEAGPLAKLVDALRNPGVCGKLIGKDEFTGSVMLADPADEPQWMALTNVDSTRLKDRLQRFHGFRAMDKGQFSEALEMVAEDNKFDSAKTWLALQVWDGTPRVEAFLTRYMSAADTPFTRATSRYIWTALSGRVLDPGCKADMVPVAVGAQGKGKSSAIAAIAPDLDYFTEVALDASDPDLARRMRGKMIIELAELNGLGRRATNALKAFISRPADQYVPKYLEQAVTVRRRGIFFGSTNEYDWLTDATGNRRWLPFEAGACDIDALKRDRDQLWAEGRDMFLAAGGIDYAEAERLATAEHERYTEVDAWTETICEWLKNTWTRDFVTAAQVLTLAVHMPAERIKKPEMMRASAVLKALGWTPARPVVEGRKVRGFLRPAAWKTPSCGLDNPGGPT